MNTTTRTYRLYAVTGLVLTLAWTGGCGSITRRDSADANFLTDGTDVLSASVDDPVHGQYELIAQKLSVESNDWQFSVRAKRANDKPRYTFRWDFDDGTISSGSSQIHSFVEPGTYTIAVSAVDARGSVAFVLSLIIDIPFPTNDSPVADAGDDHSVNENGLVFLYAGRSFDVNGDELTYGWTQLSGPPVNLLQTNTVTATFVAPVVGVDVLLEFELTVSDGELSSTDIVVVEVLDVLDVASLEPVAKAGPDQTVVEETLVALDGTASDGGGSTISFEWSQVSGPAVLLSQPLTATPTFVAPAVAVNPVQLVFELVVTGGDMVTADEVIITVVDVSEDPCARDTDGDGTVDCDDACPLDPAKTDLGLCGCGQPDVDSDGDGLADCLTSGSCLSGSTTWQNMAVSEQVGVFTAEVDVTPGNNAVDGIVALSSGEGYTFGDFATLVRFNYAGAIDVRNGSVYGADATVSYTPDQTYRLRLDVNVPLRVYSVFVTAANSNVETRVADSYAFRTENAGVGQLNNLGVWAGTGTLEVCNFAVDTGGPLVVGAGPDKTVITGSSVVLDGTVSGGTGIYNISWSPTTGLSDAHTLRPTASPISSVTYTLSVTDSDGLTDSDTASVNVQAAPLTVNAGADVAIPSGGSAQLGAVAVGGQPPYTYRWSPTATLSSSSVAAPTAAPAATTTYTVTVTDDAGTSSSDSVVVSVVDGTVFFVDKNHAGASDSNPGTEANPWKTLSKAAATAQAGDTVFVGAGVYTEKLRPRYSGAPGALITFSANASAACQGAYGDVKTNCSVILDGNNAASVGVELSTDYVRVQGFAVRRWAWGGVQISSHGNQVVNNLVADNLQFAVDIFQHADRNLVENNEIYNNELSAVLMRGGDGIRPTNLTVRANNIHYNGKDGIDGGCRQCVLELNSIYDQFHTEKHQDAFDLSDSRDMIIRYNLAYDNTQLIYLHNDWGGSENVEIYGNILYTDRYWTEAGGQAQGVFLTGARATGPIRNIKVHSNTFGWVGYDGIWVFNDVLDVIISNNVFIESGIATDIPGVIQSDYNMFYDGTSQAAEGVHTRYVNPRFVDYRRHLAWDFRLRADSPAISAGDPNLAAKTPLPADFQDLMGTPRPSGAGLEMGAVEYPE